MVFLRPVAGKLPPAQTTAQVSQYYMSHLAEFDVVAGASKQTCSGAGFTTPVAISRRRLGPSTVALMGAEQQAEEEDKGHEAIAGPTLAENQRPMYAIPSEGWMTQPDSWRYNASEDANRKSMLLRQFPTTWQSTRRLFGQLLGSTSSVEEDHASVRISGALDDHTRSSTWRSAGGGGGGGAVRDVPTSDLRSSGGGGLGPTSLAMLVDHPHPHNSLLRSPSPPSLQPPPPSQSVLSSRRRFLSVAALTGADEPVYPVLGPPTTTNAASAATVPTSRFYS